MPPLTPRELAASDQLGASFRSIAEMCAMFRDALEDQGFTEEQATKLTEIWLANTTATAKRRL